ncbi:hypothetical protein FE782_18010 [Paenibacillus antri]|uniref:Membrane protein YmcC n=1 Tax=Paenibacillus antri TaxID=2582848 RepID=A0A5R9GE64_9BACL|nr:hypothetical protein [Paenibacillus antri]TLS50943.1 hypothetical protein FE782_18010 [Paenibacillus antri]
MNLIAWSIVACEIAFWIVIGLGLIVRYVFHKKALGLALLALTPVIDLILLVIAGFDLRSGATATTAHAIAAVYIGVSVAFGKSMIQWADDRFRYYVTKQGAKPAKRYGMEYAKHYMIGWVRHLVAYAIGAGLLLLTHWLVGDAARTEALMGTARLWTLVLGIDFLIGVSNFVWPKRAKAEA